MSALEYWFFLGVAFIKSCGALVLIGGLGMLAYHLVAGHRFTADIIVQVTIIVAACVFVIGFSWPYFAAFLIPSILGDEFGSQYDKDSLERLRRDGL